MIRSLVVLLGLTLAARAALGLYGSPPPAGFGLPWTGPDALTYGIPDAERVTVPGGGHAVHMQEPERLTAEVVRFFEGGMER